LNATEQSPLGKQEQRKQNGTATRGPPEDDLSTDNSVQTEDDAW